MIKTYLSILQKRLRIQGEAREDYSGLILFSVDFRPV